MKHAITQYLRKAKEAVAQWKPTRRFWISSGIAFSILLVLFVFQTEFTYAQGTPEAYADSILGMISRAMLTIAKMAIQLTVFCLKFFILLGSYNGYIDAPIVRMGIHIVRDVANMFYIVVAMVIAFATILGIESYELRKTTPVLIVSALLTNFSDLIMQLGIDVAQVFVMTFMNAIAATAGGNLINMFSLDSVFDLVQKNNGENLRYEIFGTGILVTIFAISTLVIMATYTIMMLLRVVSLWIVMILSPLAFLLNILPSTKSYASSIWKEYSSNLVVAPVMVFFLWLSFAIFGGNTNVVNDLEERLPTQFQLQNVEQVDAEDTTIGIGKVGDWSTLAQMLVAVVFLWVGLDKTRDTGATGSGLVNGAQKLFKDAAGYTTGYVAGRWIMDKSKTKFRESAKLGTGLLGGNWLADQKEMLKLRAQGMAAGVPLVGRRGAQIRQGKIAALKSSLGSLDEQYQAQGETGIYRQGKAGRRAIAAATAQKRRDAARETAETAAFTETDALAMARAESEKDLAENQRKVLEKRAEADSYTAEDAQAKLAVDAADKYQAAIEKQRFAAQRAVEIQRQNEIFQEELDKVPNFKKLDNETQRQIKQDIIDEHNLDLLESGFAEDDATYAEKKSSAEFDRVFAVQRLGNLLGQRDTFDKRFDEGIEARTKKEGRRLTDQELSEVAVAASQGLPLMESIVAEAQKDPKSSKFKSESKRVRGRVDDQVRKGEGKDAKREQLAMDEENAGALQEMVNLTQNGNNSVAMQQLQDNSTFLKEQWEYRKNGDKRYQQQAYKNAAQRQGELFSYIIGQGWGGQARKNHAIHVNESFRDKVYNDPDELYKFGLSMLTGASYEDLDTIDKARNVQEDLRGTYKEKQARLFRMISLAGTRAANEKGAVHELAAMQTGERNRLEMTGFSALMEAGFGAEGVYDKETRKNIVIGTTRKHSGKKLRDGLQKEAMVGFGPGMTSDARNYLTGRIDSSGNEVFPSYSSPEAKRAALNMISLPASQIRNSKQGWFNRMTSGEFEVSGFNQKTRKFANIPMREQFLLASHNQALKDLRERTTAQERQKVLDRMRAFYIKATNDSEFVNGLSNNELINLDITTMDSGASTRSLLDRLELK